MIHLIHKLGYSMGESMVVGLSQIKTTRTQADVLIAHDLGSCVCICAFEPTAHVAAMVQVVLPDSHDEKGVPCKFADTAIPALLSSIESLGGATDKLRIALVGGADLRAIHGNGVRIEIGQRNIQAVQFALEHAQLSVIASDLGGSCGRTVQFNGDGRILVHVIGKAEQELVHLGQ